MSKLTKKFVESIQPDSKRTLIFWDTELKGFGVVILPSGRRTYVAQYRNIERIKKRIKVGIHGQITAEEARYAVKKILGRITQGDDPAADKKQHASLTTMEDLARDYVERHGSKKRVKSLEEDQRLLRNIILPNLGKFKVMNITRRDIETLHLKNEKTPYQANRALALLSKMFSLAISWGWREDNPVQSIQKYQEEKRDRWLDEEELQRIWEVLDNHSDNPSSYFFKLLLLTGARKGEVLNATWDQFDLKKGVWTKPSHLTKQNKREHLPLSGQTIDLLHEIKKFKAPSSLYLFPGKIGGEPLKEVKRLWNKVLKEANLENIRIHDLRHTYASHLVSSGLSLSIVGKLLGHTQASTTQRYAHLADEPLRQAAEVFGSKIGKIRNK